MRRIIVMLYVLALLVAGGSASAENPPYLEFGKSLTTATVQLEANSSTSLDVRTLLSQTESSMENLTVLLRVVIEPDLNVSSTFVTVTSLSIIESNLSAAFSPDPTVVATTGILAHSPGSSVVIVRVRKQFLHFVTLDKACKFSVFRVD